LDSRGVQLVEIVAKIADMAIRRACNLSYDVSALPPSLRSAALEIIERVASQLVVHDGDTLRCKLCGRGPFTRKGLYLHIRRVHLDQVYEITRRELEDYIWRLRNL
jgi:methyl coenzyme M reductase subunit C-like uncharacterized protein (methanogenesis marker protein 7)